MDELRGVQGKTGSPDPAALAPVAPRIVESAAAARLQAPPPTPTSEDDEGLADAPADDDDGGPSRVNIGALLGTEEPAPVTVLAHRPGERPPHTPVRLELRLDLKLDLVSVLASGAGGAIWSHPGVARVLAIGGLVAGCTVGALALGTAGMLITAAVEALAFAGGILVSRAAQQQLADANQKLQHAASHDSLTGLLNRGAVLGVLSDVLEIGHQELGIVLADIDHFKQVNDTHGHQAGDDVLRVVGLRIAEAMRPLDAVGRYGGEEMLVVLPGAGTEQAATIAERIRAAVAGVPVETAWGTIAVTASFGVSSTDEVPGRNAGILVRAADEALYRAKGNGRNRVEIAVRPSQPAV